MTHVSIIVPVYNDPKGIEATLQSLVNQEYNVEKYEILPIDNNSSDKTFEVIRRITDKNPVLVRPLQETNIQSSYAARNRGVKAAQGDILAFVDADMTMESTWLNELVTVFDDGKDCVACAVEMYIPDGKESLWAEFDASLGLPVHAYVQKKYFAPTCCLSIRKEVVDEVGLFDSRLVSGGDREFGKRITNMGIQIYYAEHIQMFHPARASFVELVKKAHRIGHGQMQLRKYHPELGLVKHIFHPSHYLPPNPERIRDRFSQSRTPSNITFILFYLIEYLLKLIQYKAKVEESIENDKHECN